MDGFKVTVKGEYFAYDGKGKKPMPYEFQVVLPTLHKAQHVIKSKILDRKLRSMFKDYASYRTHIIVDTEPVGDVDPIPVTGKNLGILNKRQLGAYIKKQKLDIDPICFPKIGDLRKAIADAEINPELFKRKEKERAEDRDLENSLNALNPDLKNEL